MHLRKQGPEKAVWLYYKSVRPHLLRFNPLLYPNWSYHKILIKVGWARWENVWLSVITQGFHSLLLL